MVNRVHGTDLLKGDVYKRQVLLLVGLMFVVARARADGAPAPSLWLSPLEIHFGSVPIGGQTQRAVDVRNLGNAPLRIDGGNVAPPFRIDLDTCAGEVAGGASCRIVFTFAPRDAGDYEDTSNGASNAGPVSYTHLTSSPTMATAAPLASSSAAPMAASRGSGMPVSSFLAATPPSSAPRCV